MTAATREIPALVLGTGVTALGTIRALAAAGVRSYVLADDPGPAGYSRWYRRAQGSAVQAEADLAGYLTASPLPRAVLVSCSDHWSARVASLPDTLRARFPASIANRAALETLMDKACFAASLERTGVDRPLTRTLTRPEDLDEVSDTALTAGFLKPTDSQSFFARYGVKAVRVTNRGEAARRAREIMGNGLSLIFQEYIPGPPRQHVFVDGFVDRGGRMIATFARRRLRMFPPDFGNSSYMVSVAADEAAPAVAALERLLGSLNYRGVFSAEFKQDPRDGGFKILEVNCRPWWYVEFAARCGVNVCDLAYRDALEQPLTPPRRYRVGRACVYPYYDFFAARDEWRRGALSILAWASSWLRAMQPVFRWADPWPGIRAGTAVIVGFVSRRLRRR